MLGELLAHPGVEEDLVLAGPIGFVAPHGGNLEGGTDTIAARAAAACGASLYAVRQPPGLRWHVPSTSFHPDDSPALAAFVAHVHTAIAIHGYGRVDLPRTILLGGRNRVLAATIAAVLRDALPDHTVIDDLNAIPVSLRGQHPANVVNLPRGAGVQIELPVSIRNPIRPELIEALAAAVRAARSP